jgi:hypothetical protein
MSFRRSGVYMWGGGGCGGDGGGGGGGSNTTPTHPTHERPRWGKRNPHPRAAKNPQERGCAPCVCAPRRCVDHTQIRRSVGNWGDGGGVATKGDWEGVREPSGTAVEAVLPRPQRSHPRLPTPTVPPSIAIPMSPCKPGSVGDANYCRALELWKSKEAH